MKKNNGTGKFVLGAALGAGIALLFAPKSGKELRADLKLKMDELSEYVKNIELGDVKKNISKKIREIENDIKNFDKEKAIDVAKKSAKAIEAKVASLVEDAEAAAKPKLIELTKEVKKKTIKSLDNTIAKLENGESKK